MKTQEEIVTLAKKLLTNPLDRRNLGERGDTPSSAPPSGAKAGAAWRPTRLLKKSARPQLLV
jgi:hypothetical protein